MALINPKHELQACIAHCTLFTSFPNTNSHQLPTNTAKINHPQWWSSTELQSHITERKTRLSFELQSSLILDDMLHKLDDIDMMNYLYLYTLAGDERMLRKALRLAVFTHSSQNLKFEAMIVIQREWRFLPLMWMTAALPFCPFVCPALQNTLPNAL